MTRCATCCLERRGPFPRATASLGRRLVPSPAMPGRRVGPAFGGDDAPARDLRAIRAAADQPTHEESARGQEGERCPARSPTHASAGNRPSHPAAAGSRALTTGYCKRGERDWCRPRNAATSGMRRRCAECSPARRDACDNARHYRLMPIQRALPAKTYNTWDLAPGARGQAQERAARARSGVRELAPRRAGHFGASLDRLRRRGPEGRHYSRRASRGGSVVLVD